MRPNKSHRTLPYYGWYIAVTLALTETISWGIIYYSFSVFLTPMQASLGWSKSELTGGFSLSLLVAGAMAYPVGAWIDKHGPRLLMTIGSIAASLLVIAWSQVTDRTAFYLIWAGLGASASAVLYEPAFAVIAQWFRQRRGTALAIVTFAAGLASTIFLPLSDALLHAYGWRTAVLLLGIFLAVITIPLHILMLRRDPKALKLLPDGLEAHETDHLPAQRSFSLREALQGRIFWLLTICFALATLAASAIRVHFISFLISTGINASTAALATGIIGIMQVAGRAIFAPLERRFSTIVITIGVFILQSLAIFLLAMSHVPLMIGLFIVIFGAAQGAMTLVRPSLLAEIFGVSHYGRIASIMAVVLTIANTAAPLGASLLVDSSGSYQLVLWIVVALTMVAGGVAFITKAQIANERIKADR